MRWWLLIYLFLEIWLLVAVGSSVGALLLTLWIIGTAFLGVCFLRRQALSLLWQNRALDNPALLRDAALGHALLALAGLLLILPGLLTDVLGLLLLLPALRRLLAVGWLRRRLPPEDGVLEGEYRVVNPDAPASGRDRLPPA